MRRPRIAQALTIAAATVALAGCQSSRHYGWSAPASGRVIAGDSVGRGLYSSQQRIFASARPSSGPSAAPAQSPANTPAVETPVASAGGDSN